MMNFNISRLRTLAVLILLFFSIEFYIYYNLKKIFNNFATCILNKNIDMQENLMNVLNPHNLLKDTIFPYQLL